MKRLLKKIYNHEKFRSLLIRARNVLHPSPVEDANMEFKYGVWQGVSSAFCEDKRQLGEDNVWPKFYREKPKTEYHESHIEGSRYGKAINLTALKLVMKNWDDALSVISHLRHQYLLMKGNSDDRLSLADIYLLSKLGVSLPAYLVRSRDSKTSNGEIPSSIATTFKIIAGLFLIIERMLRDNPSDLNLNDIVSAEDLYEYTDRNKIFISQEGGACGGSKLKVTEMMKLVIDGEKSDQFNTHSKFVHNFDKYFRYAMISLKSEIQKKYAQNLYTALTRNHPTAKSEYEKDNKDSGHSAIDKQKLNTQNNIYLKLISHIDTLINFPNSDEGFSRYKRNISLAGKQVNSEAFNKSLDTAINDITNSFNSSQSEICKLLGIKTTTIEKNHVFHTFKKVAYEYSPDKFN